MTLDNAIRFQIEKIDIATKNIVAERYKLRRGGASVEDARQILKNIDGYEAEIRDAKMVLEVLDKIAEGERA